MKKTYRRHSEEFKKEVIDYFLSSSKSITQICKEFTISPSLLYSWKQKILGDETNQRAVGEGVRGVPEDASPVQMAEEIRRLRKELTKSQRREDILKKAALILGNDPRNKLAQISTQKTVCLTGKLTYARSHEKASPPPQYPYETLLRGTRKPNKNTLLKHFPKNTVAVEFLLFKQTDIFQVMASF